MEITIIGISHKTAPVEIREKFSIRNEENSEKLRFIIENSNALEGVLLSTCNRTEVYLYGCDIPSAEKALCESCGLNFSELKRYLYIYTGKRCATYLFRVAAGLNSLILGEDEILRQIKLAHKLALDAKLSNGVMNVLFRAAVTTAKKTKTQTGLSNHSVSVAAVTANVVKKHLQTLTGKNIVAIGSGEIGIAILKNFSSMSANLFITMRGQHRPGNISNAVVIDYHDRYQYLDQADAVISCTGSPHYTITYYDAKEYIKTKKRRVFIDLAVPRDIDSDIANIGDAAYYNIDQLKDVTNNNRKIRVEKSILAEDIIMHDVEEFERLFAYRQGIRTVNRVRKYIKNSADERVELGGKKLAAQKDKDILQQAVYGAANDIINKFVYRIKETAPKEDIEVFLKCLENAMQTD